MTDHNQSNRLHAFSTAALAVFTFAVIANAHEPSGGRHDHGPAEAGPKRSRVLVAAKAAGPKTAGQGAMVFSWDQKLTAAFPAAARAFEPRMHGGFSEDVRTGTVYTGIPGYGLCSISADLTTWKRIGDDKRLASNVHGIVFFRHKGQARLALAQNDARRILIVNTAGKVLQELPSPKGGEFNFEAANSYYKGAKPRFVVTDVTYHNGTLYAVTGYSPGDFVLTAREAGGKWKWGPSAWGGRGSRPGQFRTAHGAYAHENHIYVANREAHQVVKFTPGGKLVELVKDIPKGSRVCNVAFLHDHFFFCPLARIGKQKSAPIYAHTGTKLVSTIIPGDLGVPVLNHIHHVWPHYVTKKDGTKQLYLLIHGWNRGKYAVLKHEAGVSARVDAPRGPLAAGASQPSR